eukprot:Skav225193  [mRNA]  locus=scaffold3065:129598:142690:+ [translate_table: standard]
MITPCTTKGEPYKISGCTPKMCLAPSAVEKQDYQARIPSVFLAAAVRFEGSKRLDTWDVTASCAPGFEGTAVVKKCPTPLTAYTLRSRGRGGAQGRAVLQEPRAAAWFRLKNCKPMECSSPRASMEDGYIVYEASRRMENFDVKASCAKGYRGQAAVEICSEPGGPYELSGCGAKRCVAPDAMASKYYNLEVLSRELPSFNVNVKCAEGASGAPQVLPCRKDGAPFILTGCKPDACRSWPESDSKSAYVVVEESILMENFSVSATCAKGYKGKAVVESSKCTMCGVNLGDAQASVPPALQKAQALAAVAYSVPENVDDVEEWLHQKSASDQHLAAMEEDVSGEATAGTAQMMSEIYVILTSLFEKTHHMTAATSGGRDSLTLWFLVPAIVERLPAALFVGAELQASLKAVVSLAAKFHSQVLAMYVEGDQDRELCLLRHLKFQVPSATIDQWLSAFQSRMLALRPKDARYLQLSLYLFERSRVSAAEALKVGTHLGTPKLRAVKHFLDQFKVIFSHFQPLLSRDDLAWVLGFTDPSELSTFLEGGIDYSLRSGIESV